MKLLILILVGVAHAEEKKWVWGEGKAKTSDNRNLRYNVHEYPDEGGPYPGGNFPSSEQFRPQYPGPYGPNSRPIVPSDNTPVLVGPDGPTGIIGRPGHRPSRPNYNPSPVFPGANVDPILSGHVPSWIRDDPRYEEYDACKCSVGFNCPGLKFGSCAKGKQYCCYNSRDTNGPAPGYQNVYGNYPNKYNPGNFPFRPFNAIPSEYYENGYDNNGGYYENGGYGRPIGNPNRPYHGNGQFNNGNYYGPYRGPYNPSYGTNSPYNGPYSPEYAGGNRYNGFNQGGFNWQRPYGRPYEFDNYARSAKGKNKSDETSPSKQNSKDKQ